MLSFLILSCSKKEYPGQTTEALPSHPLQSSADLDVVLEQIGNARVVMLGEASHGTHEYYEWRAALTKRLILEKGFDFIAIEGEWADSYRVNQFIKGPRKDSLQAVALLRQYDRWPTWMWGNREVASLVTWLNQYNQDKPAGQKAGFYGMDVYCLWESVSELMPYIQGNDTLTQIARSVAGCFQPFNGSGQDYAISVLNASATCKTQTERLYRSVFNATGGGETATTEDAFVAQQNALVAYNAERYYSAMVQSSALSWNIRDDHMAQTVERLLQFHGSDSKVIIWAHNTHIGDARYTDMASSGEFNLGQLMREQFGRENVYAVGFGGYQGKVIASTAWEGSIETMNVPSAQRGSWEHLLHQQGGGNRILLSSELKNISSLNKAIGHRAIGVVYAPHNERGNYVPSVIPERYDAFLYFERTTALQPLYTDARNEPPDTYPWGQ